LEPNEKDRLLNEWLNGALKQFGQTEPRPGLENRLLANLRSARERPASRPWQWWPALLAFTAILTIAVGVFLARSERHNSQAPIARKISAPVDVKGPETTQIKNSPMRAANQQVSTRVHGHSWHGSVELGGEKKEQFPSPEPLSEQEKILARYVQQFPHEADLAAQAQAEFLQEETIAEQAAPESEISSSSEAQNQ
jgi:hypothetical protein